jgi:hypothetical protein
MALYRDFFDFAAKVGCLKGYLHERKDANISTMPNWVGNIDRMYQDLPDEIKKEVLSEYKDVLRKILESYEAMPAKDEDVLKKLRRMADH